MVRAANPFDWSGGDPALDFVNTLDERPSGAPVENSQGNEISTVERDRTRRQLQRVYQEKCTQ